MGHSVPLNSTCIIVGIEIGKYGRMRHSYLLKHCPSLYQQLIPSDRLRAHLLDTN